MQVVLSQLYIQAPNKDTRHRNTENIGTDQKNIMLIIHKEFQEQLKNSPESGMGYHRVNITLNDGSQVNNIIVLNNSIIRDETEFSSSDIKSIQVVK